MPRILVVDDEIALRELIQDVLAPLGHAIETAPSGMDGLAKMRESRFDLVILDMNMPGLSGLETLQMIRRAPENAKLPVLMCTAEKMASDVDSAFELGANGYLLKPFEFSKLIAGVEKLLSPKP